MEPEQESRIKEFFLIGYARNTEVTVTVREVSSKEEEKKLRWE